MQTGDIQQLLFRLIAQTGKTDIINLTPGQIVTVLIKEVLGDMAVLSYQGRDILARLDTEVPAGQRLKCMVEGEEQGQIVLRVMSGNRDEMTAQTLRNILKTLGLADNTNNLRLVTEMVRQQLPLTIESARILSAFARTLNLSEDELGLPVFMYSRGMPLTREMYQMVKDLLSDVKYLHTQLSALLTELEKNAPAFKPGSQTAVLAANINEILQSLYLNNTDGPEVIAPKLAAILQQLDAKSGSLPEKVTGHWVTKETVDFMGTPREPATGVRPAAGQAGTGQSNTGQVMAVIPDVTPAASQTGSFAKAGFHVQLRDVELPVAGQVSRQASPDQIISRLAALAERTTLSIDNEARNQMLDRVRALLAPTNNEETVKTDLLPMLKKLAAVLTERGGRQDSELVRLARNVAGKLELIRGFNSVPEPNREGMVIVYSGVRYDDREEPLRIVINYRHGSKSRKRDFSSCRVEIKLTTRFLGLVQCEVQVNNRNLALQFTAGNEQAGRIIDRGREVLSERLRNMEYSVKIPPCKVQSREEAGYLYGRTPEIPGLYKINLRV